MIEKKELRKKLINISLVNAEHSQNVIEKLQNTIRDKIVCTYVPVSYTHLTLPTIYSV